MAAAILSSGIFMSRLEETFSSFTSVKAATPACANTTKYNHALSESELRAKTSNLKVLGGGGCSVFKSVEFSKRGKEGEWDGELKMEVKWNGKVIKEGRK